MAGNEAFERACRDTARSLRRVPKELRQTIAQDSRDEVAQPLVEQLQAAATGPWAVQLAAGTKTRKAADPTVVIGGARPVVSGGASVRQLVYGNEWGGGKRVTTVNRERYTSGDGRHIKAGQKRRGRVTAAELARRASAGKVVYRIRSTRQFVPPHPYILKTMARQGGAVLDAWARIVMRAIDRAGVDTDG